VLIDSRYAPGGSANGPGGAVIYWHVDDVTATLEKLLSMTVKEYQPVTDRGHGLVTASVVDPFGNILGIMRNPHYLEVLDPTATA
jgi:predicted enzyme related to lactoylglutathione lyase